MNAVRAIFALLLLVNIARAGEIAPFTFAVLGDNRTDKHPTYLQIIDGIRQARPALVFNTGDLIDGETSSAAELDQQWKAYKASLAPLTMPVHHVPGNHDIFNPESLAAWRRAWGPTHRAFDHGGCRFILLDTESDPGRIDDEQFKWLAGELVAAHNRPTFIFLHRPLFPFGVHVMTSLDQRPADRDRLHRLFVEHRDRIRAVFCGHEHLYAEEERDGIHYYTTGGANALLYSPPELGGFHHYLLVDVTATDARVTVRKVGQRPRPVRPAVALAPGTLLDGWESDTFWYSWDATVFRRLTTGLASEGRQAMALDFDTARYGWPSLYAPLHPTRDLSAFDHINIDVYLPALAADVSITPIVEGSRSCSAPAVKLKPGWNTIRAELGGAWLAPDVRRAAKHIQWTLDASERQVRGEVLFDRLRAVPGKVPATQPALAESWESPLLWGAWNELLVPTASRDIKTQGNAALKLTFDFATCPRPMLYAPLDPPLDLEHVPALAFDAFVPPDNAGLGISLVVLSATGQCTEPPTVMRAGWNTLRLPLPPNARRNVEQFRILLHPRSSRPAGWVVVDNFRTELSR